MELWNSWNYGNDRIMELIELWNSENYGIDRTMELWN